VKRALFTELLDSAKEARTLARLQPLGDRLLLQLPRAPEKIGRFWIPPAAAQDYVLCQAEIVARGDDVHDWRLQPGARVICKRFGRAILSDRLFVVWEHEVLAMIDSTSL